METNEKFTKTVVVASRRSSRPPAVPPFPQRYEAEVIKRDKKYVRPPPGWTASPADLISVEYLYGKVKQSLDADLKDYIEYVKKSREYGRWFEKNKPATANNRFFRKDHYLDYSDQSIAAMTSWGHPSPDNNLTDDDVGNHARSITRCCPAPRAFSNPLFDEIWLPYAKESRWTLKPYEMSSDVLKTCAHRNFSWAIPSLPVLYKMIELAPNGILEVGAGSGYWAHLLSVLGADVKAIDTFNEYYSDRLFYPIENAEGSKYIAEGKAGDRALLFSWPREGPWALGGFPGYTGNMVFFIGELGLGCTADIAGELEEAGGWEKVECDVKLPRWGSSGDVFCAMRRCGSGQTAGV